MATSGTHTTQRRPHSAGLFDIRNIIGSLIGVYGVILILMGVFGDTASDKTGGVNANLWAGLALLVVGIVFIVWALLRPVYVPEGGAQEPSPDGPPPGH